jgi:hypothetical protein
VKFAVLGGAWLVWFALVAFVYAFHLAALAQGGRAQTMAEADPGMARAMLVGLAAVLAVELCSVIWRTAWHSSRVGVTGIVVAGLSFTAPLLLAFTPIGFLLLPFAALGVFLALPIGATAPNASPRHLVAPPGWYTDPFSGHQIRYWDGMTWTAWTSLV